MLLEVRHRTEEGKCLRRPITRNHVGRLVHHIGRRWVFAMVHQHQITYRTAFRRPPVRFTVGDWATNLPAKLGLGMSSTPKSFHSAHDDNSSTLSHVLLPPLSSPQQARDHDGHLHSPWKAWLLPHRRPVWCSGMVLSVWMCLLKLSSMYASVETCDDSDHVRRSTCITRVGFQQCLHSPHTIF